MTLNDNVTSLHSYLRTCWLDQRFRSREALLDWQNRQVQRFLSEILPRSPFYQRHFAGQSSADWRTWPLTDKALMMANFDEVNTVGVKVHEAMALALAAEDSRNFSHTLNGVTVGLSSGTSGNRGLFLATRKERAQWAGAALAKLLPDRLWRGQRVAFFLRANSPLYESVRSRRIKFQFFDLLDPLTQHIDRLNQFKPTILIGPPSLLRLLAEATMAAQGESARLNIHPRKIISVAEVLDPLDEQFMHNHFGQIIHQVYQATEGFLASTCELGTLHLHEELIAIDREYLPTQLHFDEVHSDAQTRTTQPASNPKSKIQNPKFFPILTDFNRSSQPIIRYRLNDILTERAEPCPCGRVTTALAQIEGRSDDLFYFRRARKRRLETGDWRPETGDWRPADWVIVFPDFVRRAVINSSRWIWEYRVRQLAPDQLEVAIRTYHIPIEEIHNQVTQSLGDLALRLDADPPRIEFVEYTAHTGPKKLKRVERIWNP